MNHETQQNTESSTLPPIIEKQPAQIEFRQVALKVSPAEFSRMIGVSKTSVSNWIKEGRIVIDQAGKIDPKKAVQDVLRNTNPAKLKATFFKAVTNDTETLQNEIIRLNKRIGELETELTTKKSECEEWKIESQNASVDSFEFLKKIITDMELKNAVIANDYEFLELQLDDYLCRQREEENEEETTNP